MLGLHFRFTVFFLANLLLLTSCGKLIEYQPMGADDTYKVPLEFTVGSSFGMSESKQSLYQRIHSKEAVSFRGLTQTLVEDHYRNWVGRRKNLKNPSFDQALKRVRSFATPFESEELGDIKEAVEGRVEAVSGQRPVYNAQAVSILDIPYSKRMQAFSGTSLLLISLREAWGNARIEKNNIVAIYESGHVLPGYLFKKEGEWHLVGIETAVGKKGRVLYGPLKEALQQRLMRLVKLNYWTMIELFKFEADNIVDMANQALKLTAEEFGIADPAYLIESRFKREVDYSKLAWSPFSFGNPDIGVGDRNRSSFEEEPRAKLPRANPNITVLHNSPTPTKPAPETKTEGKFVATAKDPTYPYQVNKEGLLGCWDYARRVWINIPFQKEKETGFYLIRFNPCAFSKPGYPLPELPIKLIAPTPMPPGRGGPYGAGPYRSYTPSPDDDFDADE